MAEQDSKQVTRVYLAREIVSGGTFRECLGTSIYGVFASPEEAKRKFVLGEWSGDRYVYTCPGYRFDLVLDSRSIEGEIPMPEPPKPSGVRLIVGYGDSCVTVAEVATAIVAATSDYYDALEEHDFEDETIGDLTDAFHAKLLDSYLGVQQCPSTERGS